MGIAPEVLERWRPHAAQPISVPSRPRVTAEQRSSYGTVSYDELFADGVPANFAPSEEEAVLAEGLARVVGR